MGPNAFFQLFFLIRISMGWGVNTFMNQMIKLFTFNRINEEIRLNNICFAFFFVVVVYLLPIVSIKFWVWYFQVEGESSQTDKESGRTHSHTGWLNRRWPVPMAGPGRKGHSADSRPLQCCAHKHTPNVPPH